MNIYKVTLSWYDDELAEDLNSEGFYKYICETADENENFFFSDAAKALDFAHDCAYDRTLYEKMDCPVSVYIYKVAMSDDEPIGHKEADATFLASYIDVNSYLRH